MLAKHLEWFEKDCAMKLELAIEQLPTILPVDEQSRLALIYWCQEWENLAKVLRDSLIKAGMETEVEKAVMKHREDMEPVKDLMLKAFDMNTVDLLKKKPMTDILNILR